VTSDDDAYEVQDSRTVGELLIMVQGEVHRRIVTYFRTFLPTSYYQQAATSTAVDFALSGGLIDAVVRFNEPVCP